jgi:hypothetical protein
VRQPEIHAKLETQGRIFVRRAIQRLPAMQRLVIGAGQFDTALEDRMPEIIDDFLDSMKELLENDGIRDKLFAYIQAELDTILDAEWVGQTGVKKTFTNIAEKLLVLGDEQIPALLSFINIKKLVVERIDSLEMIKVERIVLDVMSNQFKWIDIFGAILGALIGIFQTALVHFLR